MTPARFLLVLFAINCIAFIAFGLDKARAERGLWRTSEDSLLWLAMLGGTAGAYAGRWLFRHKTRKQPFCARLHTIAGAQVLAGAAIVWWQGGL